VVLCAPWLDSVIALLAPRLIIPIGSLSLERFLPGRRLDDVVGSAYAAGGTLLRGTPNEAPVLLPLPHPSGQSRWLNDPGRVAMLDKALMRLATLVDWAESAP
jgi:uracil-DNA glycosylase